MSEVSTTASRSGGRLAGKRALITGGGSGIGAGIAERFREEGAAVAVGDIRPAAAQITLDVRSGESTLAGVETAVAQLGGLDLVVCNAGRPVVGHIYELAEADWDDGLATNLTSVYYMAKAAWPHLVQSRGSILTTASIAGVLPVGSNQSAYCAAKAGVAMLTRCLALEGAPYGIRANCICPGFTDTPMMREFLESQPDPEAARCAAAAMHPLGRFGRPSDIANAFVYLASDEAAWVTGVVLPVDGGFLSGITS